MHGPEFLVLTKHSQGLGYAFQGTPLFMQQRAALHRHQFRLLVLLVHLHQDGGAPQPHMVKQKFPFISSTCPPKRLQADMKTERYLLPTGKRPFKKW